MHALIFVSVHVPHGLGPFLLPDDAMHLVLDDGLMRETVVKHVVEGSKYRSPFLHFSKTMSGALHYYCLGAPEGGGYHFSRLA